MRSINVLDAQAVERLQYFRRTVESEGGQSRYEIDRTWVESECSYEEHRCCILPTTRLRRARLGYDIVWAVIWNVGGRHYESAHKGKVESSVWNDGTSYPEHHTGWIWEGVLDRTISNLLVGTTWLQPDTNRRIWLDVLLIEQKVDGG